MRVHDVETPPRGDPRRGGVARDLGRCRIAKRPPPRRLSAPGLGSGGGASVRRDRGFATRTTDARLPAGKASAERSRRGGRPRRRRGRRRSASAPRARAQEASTLCQAPEVQREPSRHEDLHGDTGSPGAGTARRVAPHEARGTPVRRRPTGLCRRWRARGRTGRAVQGRLAPLRRRMILTEQVIASADSRPRARGATPSSRRCGTRRGCTPASAASIAEPSTLGDPGEPDRRHDGRRSSRRAAPLVDAARWESRVADALPPGAAVYGAAREVSSPTSTA